MSEPIAATRTLIASHRGGALLWPENSPTAFRNTAALPVDQVEFDVHLTRDGIPVVHHDPTIDRMTDRRGRIADLTAAELRQVQLNGTDGETIPTLDEVVTFFAKTDIALRIEIKADAEMRPYTGLEADVAAILARASLPAGAIVTSFWLPVLAAYRRVDPSMPLIWLVAPILVRQIGATARIAGLARDHGLDAMTYRSNVITAADMAVAEREGIRLSTYAADDERAIRHALDLGVDVFTTDRPDLALELRDAHSAGASR